MGRKKKVEYAKTVPSLPEGWKIRKVEGQWAIVEMRIDDLKRVKLMKLPNEVREYFKERQRAYRKRLKRSKQKEKQSARKGG